jgi:ribosome-associated protein
VVRKLESYLADKARVDQDDSDLTSRSDLRKERLKTEGYYKALALRLCELSDKRLARLQLNDLLIELIVAARRIESHEARDRAVRRIRRELRDIDAPAIERALDSLEQPSAPKAKSRESAWAERLLSEGESAIEAFLSQCGDADRGQLRTLLRNALRAKPQERDKAVAKLTRALRDALSPSLPKPGQTEDTESASQDKQVDNAEEPTGDSD